MKYGTTKIQRTGKRYRLSLSYPNTNCYTCTYLHSLLSFSANRSSKMGVNIYTLLGASTIEYFVKLSLLLLRLSFSLIQLSLSYINTRRETHSHKCTNHRIFPISRQTADTSSLLLHQHGWSHFENICPDGTMPYTAILHPCIHPLHTVYDPPFSVHVILSSYRTRPPRCRTQEHRTTPVYTAQNHTRTLTAQIAPYVSKYTFLIRALTYSLIWRV